MALARTVEKAEPREHDGRRGNAGNTESRVGHAYPASVVGASTAARGGCNTGRRTAE